MTNKERMLSNKLYKVDDQLRNDARKCRKLVKEYNNLDFDDYQNKEQVLSKLLAKKGKNTYFEAPIFFDYGCHTYIGDNFYANTGCCILDCAINYLKNKLRGPPLNFGVRALSIIIHYIIEYFNYFARTLNKFFDFSASIW